MNHRNQDKSSLKTLVSVWHLGKSCTTTAHSQRFAVSFPIDLVNILSALTSLCLITGSFQILCEKKQMHREALGTTTVEEFHTEGQKVPHKG